MSKTSWQVKQRYNKKVYSRVTAELPKPLVAEFKAKCKKEDISFSKVVKYGIMQYVSGAISTEEVREATE